MRGTYKLHLSTGLASMALFLLGSVSLFRAGSVDYYSVLGMLIKVVPASLIIGALGFVMGNILDRKSRMVKTLKFQNVVTKGLEHENLDNAADDIDNIETLTPRIEIEQ